MDEVMLSALQHYAFCPRQCALIHVEQVWSENDLTAEGRVLHENVHVDSSRTRAGVKVCTNVELVSRRLGLHGRSDVVEFHLRGRDWFPYPVEYKRGSPHPGFDSDSIQLCGQALCLEEMMDTDISEGSLFYGQVRRRVSVMFTDKLRRKTEHVIQEVRIMIENGIVPSTSYGKHCLNCSLNELCMPHMSMKAMKYFHELCGKDI